jgi:hypothetical protein
LYAIVTSILFYSILFFGNIFSQWAGRRSPKIKVQIKEKLALLCDRQYLLAMLHHIPSPAVPKSENSKFKLDWAMTKFDM